jgi:transcriptional regulator with XRE-family HTH domain
MAAVALAQEITGTRIRDRRLLLGLKQAELASQAEISASYLNLIEHNRRRIGGKLLVRIAAALGVDPASLSEGADGAALDALRAVANDADARDAQADQLEDFLTRFPGWASRLIEQNQRIQDLEETMRRLNDRLTHDPVLSEKMHDVLGAVAAIRSTASILVETPDIDADWRARFHGNIDSESRKLAETSAAMAAHFDQLDEHDGAYQSPLEAVAEFFGARGYHINEIEASGAAAIGGLLASAPEFKTPAARSLGERVLSLYAEDAAALPLAAFQDRAVHLGFDPAALAQSFGVKLSCVFRRLATLPRHPGAPEIGLVTCDAAGAILLRKPPAGFSLPRFGAACALWPLFTSMRNPGTALRQVVESSEGARFIAYTIAESEGPERFDQPPVLRGSMLLVAETGEDAAPPQALQLGPTCRVCPRKGCAARREPSLLAPVIRTAPGQNGF